MSHFEYWVDYGGQPTEGFGYIGTDDEESITEIANIKEQVIELQRRYGEWTPIRLYSKEIPEGV
jgi:hypothetical protein